MFNINLLPEKEKQTVAWERRTSQLWVMGLVIAAAGTIFLILLFPSYIFLALQKSEVARSLELEEKNQKVLQIGDIASRVAAVNDIVGRVLSSRAPLFSPGDFAERVSRAAEGKVLLSQISYRRNSGEVRIAGWAGTRDQFLDFKRVLEDDHIVSNIVSPIDNVIKETDIAFSLTAVLPGR